MIINNFSYLGHPHIYEGHVYRYVYVCVWVCRCVLLLVIDVMRSYANQSH